MTNDCGRGSRVVRITQIPIDFKKIIIKSKSDLGFIAALLKKSILFIENFAEQRTGLEVDGAIIYAFYQKIGGGKSL